MAARASCSPKGLSLVGILYAFSNARLGSQADLMRPIPSVCLVLQRRIFRGHTPTLAVALANMEQGYAIGVDVAIPTDTRGEDLLAERILFPAECGLSRRFSVSPSRKVYKAGFALTAKLFLLRAISVEHDEDGGVRIHVPDAEMRWRPSHCASKAII